MAELLYRIGRFAARRRGTVVLVWLAILAVAGGAYVYAGGSLSGEITIPGTPTARVTDRLKAAFPVAAGGTGTIVFHTRDGSPISDAQRAAIADRIVQASKVSGIESVLDPFATQAERKKQAAQITDGRVKLAKARSQITHGRARIDHAKKKLAAGQAQLDAAKTKLTAGQAKLDAAKTKLAHGQAQLNAAKAELVAKQAQLDAAIAQAKQNGTYDQSAAQFAAEQAQIDADMAQITA